MFGYTVDTAAKAHALEQYPKESIGFVVNGAYVPIENVHPEPERFMHAPEGAFAEYDPQAVIHSHIEPSPRAPGRADMESQLATAVPWGIVQVSADGTGVADVLWFGEHVLDQPLIGRQFVPGVTDCYELVRAHFWQVLGITLPSFPRDAEWWEEGLDLLEENFVQAGFVPINARDAQPNDGLLMAIPAGGLVNHCGVLIENGLMLHHRLDHLSRRTPWDSSWRALTKMVVRYVG